MDHGIKALLPWKIRYSGFSYEDIMLVPVAEALGSLPSTMTKYFALQGEMGATVFR